MARTVKFLSAEESRALDARTIEAGTPGLVLMKRAAAAVAREVARALASGGGRGARVVVVGGPGNNGGDGFEAARLLLASRVAPGVVTLLVGDEGRLAVDARATLQRLQKSGGTVRPVESERDLEPLLRGGRAPEAGSDGEGVEARGVGVFRKRHRLRRERVDGGADRFGRRHRHQPGAGAVGSAGREPRRARHAVRPSRHEEMTVGSLVGGGGA